MTPFAIIDQARTETSLDAQQALIGAWSSRATDSGYYDPDSTDFTMLEADEAAAPVETRSSRDRRAEALPA